MLSLPNLLPFGGAKQSADGNYLLLKPETDSLIDARIKRGERRLAALDAILDGNDAVQLSVTETRGLPGRRKTETFPISIMRHSDGSIFVRVDIKPYWFHLNLSDKGTITRLHSTGRSSLFFNHMSDGRLIGSHIAGFSISAKRGLALGVLGLFLESKVDEVIRAIHERGQVVARTSATKDARPHSPEPDEYSEEADVADRFYVSTEFQQEIEPIIDRIQQKGFAFREQGFYKFEELKGTVLSVSADNGPAEEEVLAAKIDLGERIVNLRFPQTLELKPGQVVEIEGVSICCLRWDYLAIYAILKEQESYELELKKKLEWVDSQADSFAALVVKRDGVEVLRQTEAIASFVEEGFYRQFEDVQAVEQGWLEFRKKIGMPNDE